MIKRRFVFSIAIVSISFVSLLLHGGDNFQGVSVELHELLNPLQQHGKLTNVYMLHHPKLADETYIISAEYDGIDAANVTTAWLYLKNNGKTELAHFTNGGGAFDIMCNPKKGQASITFNCTFMANSPGLSSHVNTATRFYLQIFRTKSGKAETDAVLESAEIPGEAILQVKYCPNSNEFSLENVICSCPFGKTYYAMSNACITKTEKKNMCPDTIENGVFSDSGACKCKEGFQYSSEKNICDIIIAENKPKTETGESNNCPAPSYIDTSGKCVSVTPPAKDLCASGNYLLLGGKGCGASCGPNQVTKMGKCLCQTGFIPDTAHPETCIANPALNASSPKTQPSMGGGSCSLIR